MHNASLQELAAALRAKTISSVELTRIFLARITEHADLNAFISVAPEVSLKQAALADARLAAGNAEADRKQTVNRNIEACNLVVKSAQCSRK